MAQTIKLKRSSVTTNVPTTGQLALGEIAINTYDGKLFIKKDDGTALVVEVGGAGTHNHDATYVEVAGDTMTGDLSGITPTLPAHLTRKDYVDSKTVINWTEATTLGNALSLVVGLPTLTYLNTTDVAMIDSTLESLRTYRFDGTDWAIVGSGLSIPGIGNPMLATLNGTDVAYVDPTLSSLRTYRFNGSIWALVGSGLAMPTMLNPALTALDGTDVAFIDSFGDQLRTYRFNGTTWSQVGNNFALSGVGPTITTLNSTDIALIDGTNSTLKTYRFDGTDWASVGNGLVITGGFGDLATLNETDVVLYDTGNFTLGTYRWDGTDWTHIGTNLSLNVGAAGITGFTGTDVAILGATSDELQTYRFPGTVGDDATTTSLDGRYVNTSGDTMTGSLNFSGTDTLIIPPNYTTVGLPGTPTEGGLVYDTTSNTLKYYDSTGWIEIVASVSGNVVVDNFVDGVDYTSGTTTALTLSADPVNENNIVVYFDGLSQHHTDYTVVGTTLTFSSAIPTDTADVEVIIGSIALNTPATDSVSTATIQDGAVTDIKLAETYVKADGTVAMSGSLTFTGTDTLLIPPNYATVSLPGTPTEGGMVYDTTTKTLKYYNNTAWFEVGGLPGGSDTQLQYNNGGALGGMTEWTFADATGKLTGSATIGSDAILSVTNAATTGTAMAILGVNSAASGASNGVRGETSSTTTDSAGVYGRAGGGTGLVYGVYGYCNSSAGDGVYGYNPGASSTGSGVHGLSNSTGGAGGFFENVAADDTDVWIAQDDVFILAKQLGVEKFKVTGAGVLTAAGGVDNLSTTGSPVDISTGGQPSIGQVLKATSTTAATWQTLPDTSPGGSDTQLQYNDGGTTFGGATQWTFDDTTNVGQLVGTVSLSLAGAIEVTNSGANLGIGVHGISSGTNGNGVRGQSTSATGITYGIYGTVNSPDGYGGYFQGDGLAYHVSLAGSSFGTEDLLIKADVSGDNRFTVDPLGLASTGTTTLGNTPPTANNHLTRKDYVDTTSSDNAMLMSIVFGM